MLQKLLGFAKILNELQKVERVIRVPGGERWENDVEHSYSLAMLAWYIVESRHLALDKEKVFSYALAHDLVEVYAGDTYLYSEDKEFLASKPERERLAAERLAAEFPDVPVIHAAVRGYVTKEDPESRFVYALDKIEPVIKLYLDGGWTWKEKKVTLEMVYENKKDKVALSPEIKAYFDEFMGLLRKEEKSLFGE